MEYEDLLTWLKRREGVSAPPVIVNIEIGDLLGRLIDDRGRLRTRESVAPYPS